MGKEEEKGRYPSIARDRLVGGMRIWGGWDVFSGRREMKLLGDVILTDERKYGDDGWNS